MKKNILNFSLQLQEELQKEKTKKILFHCRNYFFTILASFIIAIAINTYMSISFLPTKDFSRSNTPSNAALISSDAPSLEQIIKSVLARNIFNITGEIPDESHDDSLADKDHFEKIPCSFDEKSPVELLGIIYTGNPDTNLVTFKDPQVSSADIYKEEQSLIDHNEYQVFKIEGPTSVQLRHGNTKICLSLDNAATPHSSNDDSNPIAQNDEESYELSADFVSKQIGEGFSKILTSAHLVPETSDNKTIGFKITGITPGSLFDSLQLKDGDIITNVNGINLEDTTQGFKLYEAFQNETSVIVKIQRQGKEITKKVTIR